MTPATTPERRAYMKAYVAKHRLRLNARLVERYATDPKYRAARRQYKAERRDELNAKQKAYALANPEKITAYQNSYAGYCRGAYARLKTRCDGRHNLPAVRELYAGIEYGSWEQFWEWANESGRQEEWQLLVDKAAATGEARYRPSVDRIDSSKGYTAGNMRWISRSENTLRALRKRWHGVA